MQSHCGPCLSRLIILALQDHSGLSDMEFLIVLIDDGVFWQVVQVKQMPFVLDPNSTGFPSETPLLG